VSFRLDRFQKGLQSHQGLTLRNQTTYRYVNSALLTKRIITNPLNSLYSYARGYRFNFPYTFPAVYMAFSDFVATLEAGQNSNPLSTIFDNREMEPAILYSLKLSGRFANLTGEKNLEELFLDKHLPEYLISTREWEDMVRNGRPAITHQIGQAIYDAGFDGIVYHSYPAWELRYIYNIDRLSNICVFMSTEDYNSPKNAGCSLVIADQNELTQRLIL
jgi:hypothetical protein